MVDSPEGKDQEKGEMPWEPDVEMKRNRAHREASRKKMLSVTSEVLNTRPVRSAQAYLELVALHHAEFSTPSAVKPDATDDEKAADRERRLAAPTTKHRKVFSEWPRDPNGAILRPEESRLGKMLANKVQFWGATLMDFYYVRRIPDCPNLATISTGSKLARWMKDKGETYATDQLARAEREPFPEEVIPYPIGGLLESLSGGFGTLQPFVKTTSLPVLQQRLLYSRLPETLIVHDPHRTLTARRSSVHPSWDQNPDIVHTYRLQLSNAGEERRFRETEAIRFAEAMEHRTIEFLNTPTADSRPIDRGFLFVPQGTKPGPCPPAVFFMHAARPPRTIGKEAHLYLTPGHLCGTGNHSVVYYAEWEVPRSLIVDDVICKKCVFEKGTEILVAEDGPNGETKDPKWLQKTGKVVETVHEDPGFSFAAFDPNGNDIKDENAELVTYDVEPPSRKVSKKYHGPVRVIDTGVKWQSAAYGDTCKHRAGESGQPSSPSKSPLTARVSIVAKMSLEGDRHLAVESDNYQEFPVHFYQHFTGYNVISPLHDPVPVGALAPQFYGYYVPDDSIPPSFWQERKKGEKAKKKKKTGDGDEQRRNEEGEREGKVGGKDERMDQDAAAGERKDVTAEGTAIKGEEECRDGPAMDVDTNSTTSEKGMAVDIDKQETTTDDKGEAGNREGDDDREKEESDDRETESDEMEEDDEDEPEEDKTAGKAGRLSYDYRSPLLLIENCGKSVGDILDRMSIDDRQECTSLYLRLHHEGWIHNSPFPRNIVYQPGPVDASPLERAQNATRRSDLRKTSFRLIDFGRTVRMKNAGERCNEEETVTKMFHVLHNGKN